MIFSEVQYQTKTVSFEIKGKQIVRHLIAAPAQNKITHREGFLLYIAEKLEGWDVRDHLPVINTVLYNTPEEAFNIWEEILKQSAQLGMAD